MNIPNYGPTKAFDKKKSDPKALFRKTDRGEGNETLLITKYNKKSWNEMFWHVFHTKGKRISTKKLKKLNQHFMHFLLLYRSQTQTPLSGPFVPSATRQHYVACQGIYCVCVCACINQWHICVAMYLTIVARSGKQQYTSKSTSGIFRLVSMMTCCCGPLPRVWLRSSFQFFAGPVHKFAQFRLTS